VSEPPSTDPTAGGQGERADAPAPGPATTAARSSDKRTLIIGLVVMVAFVAVGAVSNALFARSACDVLEPAAVEGRAANDLRMVVAAAFPDASPDTAEQLVEGITELAGELGPLTGIADVTGAERLTQVTDGLGAVGTTTTLLDPAGAPVRATAGFDEAATLVGGGDTLYALALTNPLTGQVDALQPVDLELRPGTCVDTALVGSPLAFALGADHGNLALLRVEEDGDDAELELRAPVRGRVWAVSLEVGGAPAGLLGEWSTGTVGEDLVVVGHRTRPDVDVPVLAAFERRSGEPRWERSRADLTAHLRTDGPQQVELLTANQELVVTVLQDVAETPGSAATPTGATRIVAVATADGTEVWAHELPSGARVEDVVTDGDRAWAAIVDGDATELVQLDRRGALTVGRVGADAGRLARLGDGRLVLATEAGVMVADDGDGVIGEPFAARDILVVDGEVTLLLVGPEDGAVAVTFRT
jgi:hypothetical protein